jgi:hypothetical protein
MDDQHLGESDDPQRTQRVRGKQSIRITRKVSVNLPRCPRPIGARFGQERVDRFSGYGRDVTEQALT